MSNASLNSMADAYLDALEAGFTKLTVEDHPGDARGYRLTNNFGAILVALSDRPFEEGKAADGSVQDNNPVFAISYVSKSLRNKGKVAGAYDLLDQGREIIKEIDFPLSKPSIIREFFVDQLQGGVWVYTQLWKHFDVFE